MEGVFLVGTDGKPISSAEPLPIQFSGNNGVNIHATNGNIVNNGSDVGDSDLGAHTLSVANWIFNGTNYDRQYGNTQGTLLASAARTASTYSPNITNYNSKGMIVFFNITAVGATGGLNFWLTIPDPVTGNQIQAKITTATLTTITDGAILIYPGLSPTPTGINNVVNMMIPRIFNVYVQHADSTSWTYSLGYALIN